MSRGYRAPLIIRLNASLSQRGAHLNHCRVRCCSPHTMCRDYDRLIRYTLLLPKRPAVILLSAASLTPGPTLTRFHHVPENDKLILGQYYGVPLLSVRGAAYHHAQTLSLSAAANTTDPSAERARRLAARVRPELGPENIHRCSTTWACTMCDHSARQDYHLSCQALHAVCKSVHLCARTAGLFQAGLRSRCRFLADLLVSYFQAVTGGTLVDAVTAADEQVARELLVLSYVLPDAIYEERTNTAHALGLCLAGHALQGTASDVSSTAFKPGTAVYELLHGVRCAGDLEIGIDAQDAMLAGIAVWVEQESTLQLRCQTGAIRAR